MTAIMTRRRSSAALKIHAALVLSIATVCPDLAVAEIRSFNGLIKASPEFIHYSEGFIIAPGYVDLSRLTFSVTKDDGSGYVPSPHSRGRDDDDDDDDDEPPAESMPTGSSNPPPPPTDAPAKLVETMAPTVAKAVETPAPSGPKATPAPSLAPVIATAVPVTAKPTTSSPATNAPVTNAPVTSAPVTEAPLTSAPVTSAPVTSAPVTSAPVTGAPVTATPTSSPVTEAPVTNSPVTNAPVASTPAPVSSVPTPAPVVATLAPVTPAPTGSPVAVPKDDAGDGGGRRTAVDNVFSRSLADVAILEEEAADNDDIPSAGGTSVVDIVFFRQPAECSGTQKGCDWTALGVGKSKDGNLRWCCTEEASQLGFCDMEREAGRLIIDLKVFAGEHRFVTIPPNGDFSGHVLGGDKFTVKGISGKYVMVIANCDDTGRDVNVSGSYTWASKHGYLPGELFGEMYFFAATTIIYLLVFGWYGLAMHCNRESTIEIQKWILWTILLGLLETFFNAGNYFVWNEDGVRVWYAMYTGVILGVMKRAISRCLIVMVGLGWGVVRDSLGDQLKKIIFLGVLYVGVSAACECMKIFAVNPYKTLSYNEVEELFDVVTVLTFVVAAIDVTFYMWILDALNGTMQYLENMSQTTKLKQYLRLRCFLLLSILFAVVWAIFGIVNSYVDGILDEKDEWSIQAVWELNYLMVLVGVACLWKPNKNAKEYAYVMELPSMGDDVEFETNADVIEDDDSLDDDHDGGLKIDSAVDA